MEYLCFECTGGGGGPLVLSCPTRFWRHHACTLSHWRLPLAADAGHARIAPRAAHHLCNHPPPPFILYRGRGRKGVEVGKQVGRSMAGLWRLKKKNGLPTPPHPPCSRRTVGPLAQPSTPPPPCHPLKKWGAKSKTIANPALSPLPLTSFPRREKGRRRSVEQRWSPWDGVATGVDGGRRRRVGVANSSRVWGRALSGKRLWR